MKEHNKRSSRLFSLGVRSSLAALLFLTTLRFLFTGSSLHPRLVVSRWNFPAMNSIAGENPLPISVRETVIFPDQALIFLKHPLLSTKLDAITCVYFLPNSSLHQLPPVSVDDHQMIVRCPVHPRFTTMTLSLKSNAQLPPGPIHRWDYLAYEALIDRDNSTVVFVKGLNLRSGKAADPSKFKCLYGWDLNKSKFVLWSNVVSAAQEVVRCRTPSSILNSLHRFGSNFNNHSIKVSVRITGRNPLPSIARVDRLLTRSNQPASNYFKHHEMCVCTMLRNQGLFLREWIMYHARTGVQRWFVYDNNSDDDTASVIESLARDGYNVTRHVWPWVKSQEAGFAHCALRARDSCEWVGFIDVDEFLHTPSGATSVLDVVRNESKAGDVAELRVACHSFGPSRLKEIPKKGVMAGYTCRLAAPERHKSIVKPEALNTSLINLVHHFHLRPGFRHVNINSYTLVINHYKYQVWEVFKEKFYRRVATYVSDWQQERNVGSKDRAPGLGTKAVEPSDWSTRFCEVKDTGLRDRILKTFTDSETGRLPWEDQINKQ